MLKLFVRILIYLLLAAGAIIMLLPFAWMVSTSFKTRSEVEKWPPQWGSKNFSREWNVKVRVSSRSLGGLDWRGLTLREALTLQNIEQIENVLSIVITDDPVYRGTLILKFPDDCSYLIGGLDVSEFKEFAFSLQSMTKVKEVKALLERFGNDPEPFFAAFFGLYTQGLNAVLERRNYVSMVENAIKTALNQIEIFERYSGRIPEDFKDEYLQHLQLSRVAFNDLLSNITIFRRGAVLILQPDEIEKISNLIRECLTAVSTERLSEELRNHPVVQLLKTRVVEPVEQVANVIDTYTFVLQYFKSIQKDRPDNLLLVFTFPTEQEKRDLFLESLAQAKIEEDFEILKKFVSESLEGVPEKYEKFLDELIFKEFSYLSLPNLRFYVQQIKIALSGLRSVLTNFSEWLSMEDFDSTIHLIKSNALLNQTALAALERLEMLSKQIPARDFQKLLVSAYKNLEKVFIVRQIDSKVKSVMKIISSPSFVKEVRLKQNQNIEIDLVNVHPVYLEDESYALTVKFNLREMFGNIFHNYVTAWKSAPFGRYYLNTIFVSVVTNCFGSDFIGYGGLRFLLYELPCKEDHLCSLFGYDDGSRRSLARTELHNHIKVGMDRYLLCAYNSMDRQCFCDLSYETTLFDIAFGA